MPPFTPGQPKIGGRSAGTPNKATQKVKDFFEGVLDKAFADPAFEPALVQSIVTMSIDTKLFLEILQRVAGKVPNNHKHGVDNAAEKLFAAIAGVELPEGDA